VLPLTAADFPEAHGATLQRGLFLGANNKLLFLFVFLFMRSDVPKNRSPGCAFIGSV
jgi:hypothetical protein